MRDEREGRQVAVRGWTLLVPLTALGAGLLFATSAATAQGTDLRADRRLQLTELIARERAGVEQREREAAELRAQVAASAERVAAGDSRVRAAAPSPELEALAGLTPATGPGIEVVLDDAPRRLDRDPATDNDDLVVHQQDLDAVVNAVWAGGAEAVAVMGQRIVSTSAIVCVGSTVLVDGRPFTPPYRITAVGEPGPIREALDAEPGVDLYREYVEEFGLRYDVETMRETTLMPYDGPLELPNVAPR